MRKKPSTKRARSPTTRLPEAPPGWSKRWRVYRSSATATKHAIRHRVVSQIVLPEVAAFMADRRVLVRDHRDEVRCVDNVGFVGVGYDSLPTTVDMKWLEQFPYLVRLSLHRRVAKLTSLQKLDLRFSRGVNAAGLAALAELPQLESLDLGQCHYSIDAECLAHVAKLSTLRYLGLSMGHYVGAAALSEVAKLTELRYLDISRCGRVDAQGVAEVAKLSQLQRVNLELCHEVDAAAIAELSKLPHLVQISVAGCKVSATEVAVLLPKCRVDDRC